VSVSIAVGKMLTAMMSIAMALPTTALLRTWSLVTSANDVAAIEFRFECACPFGFSLRCRPILFSFFCFYQSNVESVKEVRMELD